MTYLLIRHEVDNFDKWKPVYDSHKSARENADLREIYLLQNRYNHNEVVVLFEAGNEHKAQEFIESNDLKEAMKAAGVVGTPEIRLLDQVSS